MLLTEHFLRANHWAKTFYIKHLESHLGPIQWVLSSCLYHRRGNWSLEQLYVQRQHLNPSLMDPRVCVHCRFTAYDHEYIDTRKVDQGQNQGTWGIRKTYGSPAPGLDHMWQKGADRKHYFFSESAYGCKGENQVGIKMFAPNYTCYSAYGPQISSISISGELVRRKIPGPSQTEPESAFRKVSGRSTCT